MTMDGEYYWATRIDNGHKVIVHELPNPRPDLKGKYVGYFLPEWEKDGRKRRKYKNALYLQFVCDKDSVILGDPVQFEIKHNSQVITLGSSLTQKPYDEPVMREETITLIIDGVEHSRSLSHSIY